MTKADICAIIVNVCGRYGVGWMSDWGNETLDEWRKTAAAKTGERLNAMDQCDPDAEGESAPVAPKPEEGTSDAPPRLEDADGNDEIRPVPVFAVLTEPESSDTARKRGRWEVVTEASKYYLDLDREMLLRVRGKVQPENPEVMFPTKLRDHNRGWVRLLRIIQLELGKPAIFDIESLGGPEMLFTRRSTTWVISIRQLAKDEPFD
ncbi:hypothetical protein [Leifsonia sp. 21MFCrub1.1]|uniref:hypothetical protein n=1 Tax=Leifsonia sp. 21MFCrub1.1 TaxID=1798223 RepID=UPI0012FE004D|nr:hypothetical protein [Leifsonia sp. 21MFCrub1.1]